MTGGRSETNRVGVIGAGAGGIAAMKALRENDVAFDCFDERAQVGGIWAWQEAPGRTCAWDRLNMNSPRGTYEFSDFPMPSHYPDFPTRAQCQAYLEAAVDHYGLRTDIRLDERVEKIERVDELWTVTLASGERRGYRALVVANGHHNTPRYPEIAGKFDGETIHSRDYRRREPFAGKRVMVVGYGNSGAQLAVDVSHTAEDTILVMRSGTYILPHYIRNIRVDRVFDTTMFGLAPFWLENALGTMLYRLVLGRPERHGLPRPKAGLGAIFPTVSDSLINRVGDGRIRIRPQAVRTEGRRVTFANDTTAEIDTIIHATGYHLTFPFLPPGLVEKADNRICLYMRTFLPSDPTLSIIGAWQGQATWGFLPAMEAQARLVGAQLSGRYVLPEPAAMRAAIDADARSIARMFVDTPRHHYQLYIPHFLRAVRRELRRGAQRRTAETRPGASRGAPSVLRVGPRSP